MNTKTVIKLLSHRFTHVGGMCNDGKWAAVRRGKENPIPRKFEGSSNESVIEVATTVV